MHRAVMILGMAAISLWPAGVAQAFDLSRASVPQQDIVSGGPPKDGIPALTDPERVPAKDATYLRAEDRVLGIEIDGHARAYPIRLLNWHEVVNDQLGETPVVVTYCPLCGTGMVFRAHPAEPREVFGVSGLLYNSDVLLYDRATESLWSQLKMEAVAGPRTGDRLKWMPAQVTTWEDWLRRHPQTTVLSLETGYARDYGRDPYAGYGQTARIWFPVRNRDSRLHPKAWVLGLVVDEQARAYPLDELVDGEVLEDQVGTRPLHIRYDASAETAWVEDAEGAPVASVLVYWFAWAAFYPDTFLYERSGQSAGQGELPVNRSVGAR